MTCKTIVKKRGVIGMKFNVLRSKISAPAVFISVFPF